jgi:hypothetical protein
VIVARSVVSPARLSSFTQSPSHTPRCSASCGWISSRSSSCQTTFSVRRVWAPTLYWLRMRPVVSSSGKRGPDALVGRHVLGDDELALAAHEAVDVHDRRAERARLFVARPLDRADLVERS